MASEKVANGPWLFKRKRPFRFDELDLKKNKTFIIPTLFGLVYGSLLLVLMMFALGYANNLLYFFVFLLISMALSTMLITNQNTDRVKFVQMTPSLLFAEEASDVLVSLKNSANSPRYNIQMKLQNHLSHQIQFDAQEEKTIRLQWTALKRGKQKIPNIQIFCTYPFGILKSWKIAKPDNLCIVFPAKKGSPEFPQQLLTQARQNGSGIFKGLNEYQSGASYNRIHWRSSSKHQTLLVKNFEQEEELSLPFEWSHTKHLKDVEARLSQLSLWIYLAEKLGIPYSLSLASFTSDLSQGAHHLKQCMEALALFSGNIT